MENNNLHIIDLEEYSFWYPQQQTAALKKITLCLKPGGFYVLCGRSGSGKSTLLRQCKTALAPKGTAEGAICYFGEALQNVSAQRQSREIGFVFQSPDNQIVTDKVWHELAFGLENLGMSREQIHLRVAEMASYFGITEWFYRDVASLSGGQKQLLNLASVLAMHPKLLLLDEPTSQLDPVAGSNFLSTLHKINRELGITIFLSEHNLEEVLSYADQVFVMEDGEIIAQDAPDKIGLRLLQQGHGMFAAMPAAMRIFAEVSGGLSKIERCPYTVAMGRQWLSYFMKEKGGILPEQDGKESSENKAAAEHAPNGRGSESEKKKRLPQKELALELRNVSFSYGKALPRVLSDVSLQIEKGEIFALTGANGAGKSTALQLMAGVLQPLCGQIFVQGKAISAYTQKELYHGTLTMLQQEPTSLFVKKTVREELTDGVKNTALLERVTELTQLEDLQERHPLDLSGGEQQRLAFAKLLLREPQILLLDEPTKGFDAEYKKTFGAFLRRLQEQGMTIVLVSHDLEFCAEYAGRIALFFAGGLATVQETHAFFAGNHFYTTAANRMARDFFPEAVTVGEVTASLRGESAFLPQTEQIWGRTGQLADRQLSAQTAHTGTDWRKWYLPAAVFLLTPLTIWAGIVLLDDRNYFIISLLIACYALVPFLGLFERRRTNVQMLVVIAVLTAAAVAGRAAFFMVPSVKPMAAVAILAGISLGAQSGFLVGALSMLASNMLFGQGPWTPWQMLALGLIGFFAGVLASRGNWMRRRTAMCVYGFFSVLLLYGGIMNPASLLMVSYEMTAESLTAIYLSGLPLDLVHAVSTVLFLFVGGTAVLDKLDRIQLKYHLEMGKR